MELYRLVRERYRSSKLEGYDLMLRGDLHTLLEPDEESEIWMNKNEYNLISWSLCDLCGVHILLMQNGIAIHMLTEKKYPPSQEMISKMLNKRLEVKNRSRRGINKDTKGVDFLPNATIFEQLTLMSMVKNLDSVGKFLMYPRFIQGFLNKQVNGMSKHNGIYVMPSHTKKIFRNMKRVGKGFSRSVTPLFPTMMVQAQEEMGEDEAVYEEMGDNLERAATTTTSLDAEQDRGNINKIQSKATLNEPSSLGTSSSSGPRNQETMEDTIAQTGFENVSKTSNDSLLAGVNTPRSDKDSLKLKELMELCTNLQNRVIDLEKTKTSQAQEIISLKIGVKRLEKKNRSKTHRLKILYKVGLSARIESSDDDG
ncbi:hypothetical protein Tco_0889455, partial [Tanacetum coccineum]